jgi:hypothetical protein
VRTKFVTRMGAGMPNLPPMDSDVDDYQLHYTEDGILYGGFSVFRYLPNGKLIVEVATTQKMKNDMKDKNYELG